MPPALNRFSKTLDKNMAESLFKVLMKYRPEDKAAKKQRLLAEAEARAAGERGAGRRSVCGGGWVGGYEEGSRGWQGWGGRAGRTHCRLGLAGAARDSRAAWCGGLNDTVRRPAQHLF